MNLERFAINSKSGNPWFLEVKLLKNEYSSAKIGSRMEADLRLASEMAMAICENNFGNLLEMRLGNDQEMVDTVRKETIAEIKKHGGAVVSSGYSDDPVMADFRKIGFSGVIAKPYRVAELGVLDEVIMGRSWEGDRV